MKILITGGAGFIGVNTAAYYLKKGDTVIILDNLSRTGADKNIEWLKKIGNFKFYQYDIRNYASILKLIKENMDIDIIFHFAAQVAVTSSIIDPRADFEINALGTFNLLEAVRENALNPIIIYSSTNKVYGGLKHIEIIEKDKRYEYKDFPYGITENTNLDFHSPYGCSKGAADQYIRDYNRIYGLRTVIFRQSCIYGYRQFGMEDQGWIAWFIIAAALNKKITVYGNGKQMRDILFIDDLIDAYDSALKNRDSISGKIFNIGGGNKNQLSILELIDILEKLFNKKIEYSFADIRPGDQPVFVCDILKAGKELHWSPKTEVYHGIEKLYNWITENKELFK